ncbi:MAG: Nif3-like dinuclear metal center hexameric protein [Abditibacteriota bacterium]|nr:Nif3-like dinuclear metal center hexameric protein [Abditibacteriota bacterium]
MRIKDFYDGVLDRLCPFSLAEDWDRSGFALGDKDRELEGCLFCLDLVPEAIDRAAEYGANVIVTHHPYIFEPLRELDFAESRTALLETLIKQDIALIQCHTNLDSAAGGVSDVLCRLLDVEGSIPIIPKPEEPAAGLGRIGILGNGAINAAAALAEEYGEHTPPPLYCLAETYERCLREGLEALYGCACGRSVRYAADRIPFRTNLEYLEPRVLGRLPERVAVCGGAGADICKKAGADCYITGEVKRHQFMEAALDGVLVIEAGHFETEAPGIAELYLLAETMTDAPVYMYCDPVFVPDGLMGDLSGLIF